MLVLSGSAFAQVAGTPGAFARMGFGARGMGMGNAMTAVATGELSGYYNPAVAQRAKERGASLSYGILSLDRQLNAVFYSQPIDTNAGISFGILNSGVADIDGRDIDGFPTELYSTSENLFSLSFALKIRKISLGITTKLYYNSLFKDLSSTALGFDFGAVYPLTSNITIGAAVKDINSKYKWDTSILYDQLGNSTTEKFPQRHILGIAYALDDDLGLVSAEIESNDRVVTIARLGAEVNLIEQFTVRAGVDGWDLKDAKQAHPSFGFTLRTGYSDYQPSLHYAFVVEPYGVFTIHVISLSVKL